MPLIGKFVGTVINLIAPDGSKVLMKLTLPTWMVSSGLMGSWTLDVKMEIGSILPGGTIAVGTINPEGATGIDPLIP